MHAEIAVFGLWRASFLTSWIELVRIEGGAMMDSPAVVAYARTHEN